ncbi:MAG: hypothetical protein LUO89_09315 [Methanothrix sp.]|nr:hypothetical protein [Methanothrix sp.]
MRTARTFGVLVPLLLLWGGGAVGCNCGHADCASIAPGTPVADIPIIGGPSLASGYCSSLSGQTEEEVMVLRCCSNPYIPSDGGVRDCSSLGYGVVVHCALPTEFRQVREPYSGWECARDEGWGPRQYQCYVWVQNGLVVGACGGCPLD